MKLRLIVSLLLVGLLFTATSSVRAQTYLFSLDTEVVHVFWNSDGSVALDYVFVFTNSPSADPIDFVDVGMPNDYYDWNSISADVNGTPVSISSDYYGSGYGFAVDLGSQAIAPGETGRVHVYVGRVTNMLYPSDEQPDTYVSGQFSPTWFGSEYVTGNTNLTVVFHLPPGVQPDEPVYYPAKGGWPCDAAPAAAFDNDGRITYTWSCESANAYTQYIFGLSFPKQYVPEEAIVTSSPFDEDVSFDEDGLITFCFFCCFGLFIIGSIVWAIIGENKRKLQYMPPKISLEGHGIKRGLTAVEAAVLMQEPLDKVLTMILFGVVKKGAATVISREPLKLEVASPLPENLHEYEKDFLAAFTEKKVLAAQRKALQEMVVKLVKSVEQKMKGFSRRETVNYYKAIMQRAWQQIEAAGTPEVKSKMYEEALEWTMLDKDYDEHTRRVFTGPVYLPMWWANYDPDYRPVSTAGGGGGRTIAAPSTSGGRITVPGSDFAASVVKSVQSLASRTLGDVKSFTSDVTDRTNPLPKSTSSGYRGGGGRSCACACACAGCACACAGGGR